MDASQVLSLLRDNISTPSVYVDVVSIDTLPSNFKLPLYLVVNLDKISQPGSHWVSVFINSNKQGIFLDSFGQPPPSAIESFLQKRTVSYEYSNVQLQAFDSKSCGLFSAVALVHFHRNKTLKQFLSNFAPYNTLLNEYIIRNMSENKCFNKFNK